MEKRLRRMLAVSFVLGVSACLAATGDYRIVATSALIAKGVDYAQAGGISLVDLAGQPRIIGSKIDIGCYEGKASGLIIMIK